MIHLGRLLTEPGTPTIRSLYVYQGNPATVLYDQDRVRRGLARDDLFTVVHEQVMTDTARHADIVLPATTQFEQPDILFSYFQPSLLLNRPAIEPVGEARSNLDTFNALADAMGFEEPCFRRDAWGVIEEVLDLDHPAMAEVSRQALRTHGWAPMRADDGHDCFLKGRFPTPSGRIEFFSETMAGLGLDPLPSYTLPREGPETTPGLFAKYPLWFLTPSAHATLNSAYASEWGDFPSEGPPPLIIHPDDAESRGIRSGDAVHAFNDRGACGLTARVDAAVRPGVVVGPGSWWSAAYADGCNANHTTPDFPADMGGGSAFNTNLVQVERQP
jgi:anaerobic selenocysteine-containing dehydrogenase